MVTFKDKNLAGYFKKLEARKQESYKPSLISLKPPRSSLFLSELQMQTYLPSFFP